MAAVMTIPAQSLQAGMVCVYGLGSGRAPKKVLGVVDAGNRGMVVTYATQFGETCSRLFGAHRAQPTRPQFVQVLA